MGSQPPMPSNHHHVASLPFAFPGASLTVFLHTVRIHVDLRYDYINKSSAPEYTYTRNLFIVKFATLHMGEGRVLVDLVGYTCIGALVFLISS